jgi:hypothetical protein
MDVPGPLEMGGDEERLPEPGPCRVGHGRTFVESKEEGIGSLVGRQPETVLTFEIGSDGEQVLTGRVIGHLEVVLEEGDIGLVEVFDSNLPEPFGGNRNDS